MRLKVPMTSLGTVFAWLSPESKKRAFGVIFLIVISSLIEIATLNSVIPFLSLLLSGSNPDDFRESHWLVSHFSKSGNQKLPLISAIAFVTFVLASSIMRVLTAKASASVSQKIGYDLAVKMYSAVLGKPYTWHINHNSSESVAAITKVNQLLNGLVRPAFDVTVAAFLATALLGSLIMVSPALTVIGALIVGAVYTAISFIAKQRLHLISRHIAESNTEQVLSVQEGIGAIRDVILNASQKYHVARFSRARKSFSLAQEHLTLWEDIPRYVIEAIGISLITTVAYGMSQAKGGFREAIPFLGALALGSQRLLPLFQRIYAGWTAIRGNRGSLEDVQNLIKEVNPKCEPSSAEKISFEHNLELRNVSFRYSSERPWVLKDINLVIPKGARVGISGETGKGKSTIIDVLMGLLPPSEGCLLTDGVPITHANVKRWQEKIAHVPQMIFLADMSVAENIAFGVARNEIDYKLVEESAIAAQIHNVIQELPSKYHTKVGEKGIRLSGGQRQRLGIARALYRKAELLVLDEATSALDQKTETDVMNGISNLRKDMTVVIVAHRLSTLDNCNIRISLVQSDRPIVQTIPCRVEKEKSPQG